MALVLFNKAGVSNSSEVMINSKYILSVEPASKEGQTIIYMAAAGTEGPHRYFLNIRYEDAINRLVNEVPEFRTS
ncbi:hypothetical protein [Sinorhizobium fredii]|uniref:hypothetical protein n=1 Tax=Rhizobium fredii TaxID=380 RepID=UPI001304174B|nr:hypothetical protein [Sinorhizobium fredii]